MTTNALEAHDRMEKARQSDAKKHPALSGWKSRINKRVIRDGIKAQFVQVRDAFKRNHEVNVAWALAERQFYPNGPWDAPEPGVEFVGVPAESDKLPEEVMADLVARIPLSELPDERANTLETLKWVCAELGKRDPELTADAVKFREWRRRSLAGAPSYEARWLLMAATDDPKVEADLRSAWKTTLPSRQQIENSERLADDGRRHIGFIEECKDKWAPLFEEG